MQHYLAKHLFEWYAMKEKVDVISLYSGDTIRLTVASDVDFKHKLDRGVGIVLEMHDALVESIKEEGIEGNAFLYGVVHPNPAKGLVRVEAIMTPKNGSMILVISAITVSLIVSISRLSYPKIGIMCHLNRIQEVSSRCFLIFLAVGVRHRPPRPVQQISRGMSCPTRSMVSITSSSGITGS